LSIRDPGAIRDLFFLRRNKMERTVQCPYKDCKEFDEITIGQDQLGDGHMLSVQCPHCGREYDVEIDIQLHESVPIPEEA
jgi:hypothetical protein